MVRIISEKKATVITFILAALILLFSVCSLYLSDYYRADREAIEDFAPYIGAEHYKDKNGYTVFEADGSNKGFIFYPGGKVEADAYLPLMAALAERGITSVLVKMPFNLAVLDMNAADGIRESFPQISEWYIGGHSLGGSMAASYASSHCDEFAGLILLGAYSTADLSGSALRVLCMHGTEDGVMNREKHDEYLENLPASYVEQEIEGGCHAYFGMYGAQAGDGDPTLTPTEQITISAEIISDFITGGN